MKEVECKKAIIIVKRMRELCEESNVNKVENIARRIFYAKQLFIIIKAK